MNLVGGTVYMENPYESPQSSNGREVDDGGSTSLPTLNSVACALFVLIASVLCWVAFVFGFALSFKDLFGGPPPVASYVWLGLAIVFGLVAEIMGIAYFNRRQIHAGDSSGTFVLVVVAMLGDILPISFSALAIVHDLLL